MTTTSTPVAKTTKTVKAPAAKAPAKTTKTAVKAKAKTAKVQVIKDKVATMALLGEIITWNARTDREHTIVEVTQALASAGLPTDAARELLPRHAFARACRKLSEDRMIDAVNETDDVIVFQFTRKFFKSQEELGFSVETHLRLNKVTGIVTCDNTTLQDIAQQELNAALVARSTNDITRIVQKLFEQNADLFSVRDQGGVYFVPIEHCAFIAKVETFLEALGGSISRFPVPAGTSSGSKAVQQSVAAALEQIVSEHMAAVNAFSLHTRQDTIATAADRIKETRVKVQAYAHYLQERSTDLLATVDAANARLVEQVAALSNQRSTMPASAAGSDLLFGHPVTAVIRWMGRSGWDYTKAATVLLRFASQGITVAEATIRTQLAAGKKGQRGEPANLSEVQIAELSK